MANKNIGVYVFKVALANDKRIWRRIAVHSKQTLEDLNYAIFDGFDRFDDHLYSFFFPMMGSLKKFSRRDCIEYTSPVNIEEAIGYKQKELYDASRTKIGSLDLAEGQKFMYLFDFGDMWWHEITVEKVNQPSDENAVYPIILTKHGISPEQYS